ncbi:MAG: glycosyltransferase family 39 protein [Caldilineaceae bacterium]
MSRIASFTSATKSARTAAGLALGVLLLGGLLLRSGRLLWQPLWWDEGYSVYFATETLPHMLWLTARDIHPPLYYALLHGWIALLGGPEPRVLRTFSVLIGFLSLPTFYGLAAAFFPKQPRTVRLALILLLVSPIHIFYSQEVRMYGLSMLLGMAATACFWLMLQAQTATATAVADPSVLLDATRNRIARYWIGYLLFTTLALYTLYYAAFLFAAHLLWAIWHFRKRITACWPLITALLLAGLLYLPWVTYTATQLQSYVSDKVAADNDAAIGLGRYLLQHLVAFTGGHLASSEMVLMWLRYAGLAALVMLLVGAFLQWQRPAHKREAADAALTSLEQAAPGALFSFLLIPSAISFVINLFLPFAPEGGERLLLFVLPYFLLLLALGIARHWHWRIGKPALLLLLVSAAAGVFTFYTLPRYAERDYRPVVGQMLQQGADGDAMLALFPWQVGYWRAYTAHPLRTLGTPTATTLPGPQPLLIGQKAVEWDAQVEGQLQDALSQGALWFPEPLSLGSDLPLQIEMYLWHQIQGVTPDGAIRNINLANGWANPTTRVTAWRWLPLPPLQPLDVQWGPLTLQAAGIEPERTESANRPLAARLRWQVATDAIGHSYQMSLRVQDQSGRVWASRDLPVMRQDELVAPGGAQFSPQTAPAEFEILTGLLIPAGLPPGEYHVVIGVGESSETVQPAADARVAPLLPTGQEAPFVQIGAVQIDAPAAPLPAFRLPIQHELAPAALREGVAFLGYAGFDENDSMLAGADFSAVLFLQNRLDGPPTARNLYVSLLDGAGAGVAGWEGWPLPAYPLDQWGAGALAQLPLDFALPATLESGTYRVISGLLDPATGEKSAPVALGPLQIRQRAARLEPPTMAHVLDAPVQFGAHAQLIGYELTQPPGGGQIELRLYWRALQPLLPAHNIFVHLEDETGQIVAQSDGPPRNVLADGATESAPTGSWRTDEYLTTLHVITVPPALQPDFVFNPATGAMTLAGQALQWRIGLYVPPSGPRLPTSINGQPSGDAAVLP